MPADTYRLTKYRGKWAVTWTETGGTRRVSCRTADHDEAQRFLVEFQRAMAAPRVTVAEIFAAYLHDATARGVRRIDSYNADWVALRPYFGHLLPNQITRETCRLYAQRRVASAATIHSELGSLQTALNWSSRDHGAQIERPAAPKTKERWLSQEEMRALLDAARQTPHLFTTLHLLIATAARVGAILDLTWDRVDFKRGLIVLATGESQRKSRATIPITRTLRTVLEQAEMARTQNSYVIEYGGTQVKSVKKSFGRARDRAGLGADVTLHTIRHTAATWLVQRGTPIETVSRYLGHSSPTITYQRYAHHAPDYLRDAADILDIGVNLRAVGSIEP